jgi:hypothetical protein
MQTTTKYLFVYVCVLCLLLGSVGQLAQAQEKITKPSSETSEVVELDQAQLDQILAPIALYPDTLLSHILVASTYPLEVIQAARWRSANEDLDEQQALNAVDSKDWDPSVKALVPFNDLLHRLSQDLDWLQSLGSAFLVNEQQILTSVQNLRQKAYEQGNLSDNDYVNVEQEDEQIIIQTVRKEVVYVPYYDTRVVYGNWWWNNHQPYYWHHPKHSIYSAGLYWGTGFYIRPSFYFGGFHWRNRHVVANYHLSTHANRYWSNNHDTRQIVRVKEYPRWSHNQQHRRGAQHRVNGQRVVRNLSSDNKVFQQIDKQRVLNVNNYAIKHNKNSAKRVKQALGSQHQTVRQTKLVKSDNRVSNKQRTINQSTNQKRQKLSNDFHPNQTIKLDNKQRSSVKSQKYTSLGTQRDNQKRATVHSQTKTYKTINNGNNKSRSHRANSHKQNKSRPVKVARQSNREFKQ